MLTSVAAVGDALFKQQLSLEGEGDSDLQCLHIYVVLMLPLWPIPSHQYEVRVGSWGRCWQLALRPGAAAPRCHGCHSHPRTWVPSYLGISFPVLPNSLSPSILISCPLGLPGVTDQLISIIAGPGRRARHTGAPF